ncbi:MAG: ATP-dependent RNA helicase HrpA [Candidatus Berkiella sp.]
MLEIKQLLKNCLRKDQFLLRKRLAHIEKIADEVLRQKKLQQLFDKITTSNEVLANRKLIVPASMSYPDLPIMAKKQEIIDALLYHQVIIVAGETGSGKTTQLPKFCIEAGFGVSGLIGHTQPRRLAARSIATRIASELNSEVGYLVGYQVRFSDKTSPSSLIKLMTDGILLSETQHDKWLNEYDCIIIDEAHERSLNIDFLLGFLKNLCQKRRDLKVIVTSATIDVERFSAFFNNAPLIQVEGRTFPVEVHYLPQNEATENNDPVQAVVEAVQLAYQQGPGDILIFQSGEKEIREVAEALNAQGLPNSIVLPLFSRQSVAEQQKIFQTMHKRKIIIATNIAETSITVPNIRFVIDGGLHRISRYNYRNKLQRLPIEPISQASGEQRKGRCGRVGPGVCYRLYSEEDFLTRDLFTEPEILRTNLAGVILKMLALGWKDIQHFPFLDAPDNRFVKDGYALLERLGAVSNAAVITPIGRQLAQIPIEPRLGRIIIAANQYGALAEILIIVSGLSIMDPREYPVEFKEKASLSHTQFAHPESDFLSYLKLWTFISEQKQKLSNQKFRKLCRENFLSYLRICEWLDVHAQLQDVAKELHFKINQVASDTSQIHKSILSGLLDGIGLKEDKTEYLGARGVKFFLHPGSTLFKKPPTWVVACEIVHTTKTYARINAQVELKWIEEVAKHLLKRQYVEAHFDLKEQRVVAYERATLFGLEIISRRKVSYEKIAPLDARKIFIWQGLVEQQLETRCAFYKKNCQTVNELRALEDRTRRQVTMIDEGMIAGFYEKQLPMEIMSTNSLEQWAKQHNDSILIFTEDDIGIDKSKASWWEKNFPSKWVFNDQAYSLHYHFDLSADDDGVTVHIPIESLADLCEHDFSWLVDGLLTDKIATYLKSLPKRIRVLLNPLPETLAKAQISLNRQLSFDTALRVFLEEKLGFTLSEPVWDNVFLPAYLKMHFMVIGKNKELLAKGDNLSLLYEELRDKFSENIAQDMSLEKQNLTRWDFQELPVKHILQKNRLQLTYYPALVDKETSVSIQLFDNPILANYYHRLGLARLYLLTLKDASTFIKKEIQAQKKILAQQNSLLGDFTVLTQQLLLASALHTFTDTTIRTREAFDAQLALHRHDLAGKANLLIAQAKDWLTLNQQIERLLYRLADKPSKEMQMVLSDIENQLKDLFEQHFLSNVPLTTLLRYTTYLKGILVRLEKLPRQLGRDQEGMTVLVKVQKAYESKLASKNQALSQWDDPLLLFRFKIEELRISLFAEKLGTQEPVSAVRLFKLLEKLG